MAMSAAPTPAGRKPTKDPQLKALTDSVKGLMDRLDALTKRFGDDDDDRKDRRRDARKDDDNEACDDDDRRDAAPPFKGAAPPFKSDEESEEKKEEEEEERDDKARGDKEFGEWAKEEEDEPEHKEEKDDSARGDEGTNETMAAPMASDKRKDGEEEEEVKDDDRKDARADDDDDDRKDRRDRRDRRDDRRDDDDDDRRRDSRSDARLDSALARRLKELERTNKRLEALERDRMRSDEEVDRIATSQQEWSKIALAHGDRRSMQPMVGESPTAYDRRHAQYYKKHSKTWAGVDLRNAELAVLKIAVPAIRADAMAAAYTAPASSTPLQREVKETDRTGRQISRFVGPVDAINGMMAPFMLPRLRARIIPPSQQGVF